MSDKTRQRKPYDGNKDEWLLETGRVVISSPSLPQEMQFFIDGDELKAAVKLLREGEDLRIIHGQYNNAKGVTWSYTRLVAVDTHHRYTQNP